MSRKTTAQWRREFPAYDKAIRAVEHATAHWPVVGPIPRMIAHIHPDTYTVSIVLDGSPDDYAIADQILARCGYRTGWVWDATYARAVWRKVVAL